VCNIVGLVVFVLIKEMSLVVKVVDHSVLLVLSIALLNIRPDFIGFDFIHRVVDDISPYQDDSLLEQELSEQGEHHIWGGLVAGSFVVLEVGTKLNY
jgi:phosphatidylethanolamine-binding protein (PEBP) family uncharacterized protein